LCRWKAHSAEIWQVITWQPTFISKGSLQSPIYILSGADDLSIKVWQLNLTPSDQVSSVTLFWSSGSNPKIHEAGITSLMLISAAPLLPISSITAKNGNQQDKESVENWYLLSGAYDGTLILWLFTLTGFIFIKKFHQIGVGSLWRLQVTTVLVILAC
jgi:WD40 repeat protein